MKPIVITFFVLLAQRFMEIHSRARLRGLGERRRPIAAAQLYDLGETKNVADRMPEKVAEMQALLEKLITDGRSKPGAKQKNDVEVVRFPRVLPTIGKAKNTEKKQIESGITMKPLVILLTTLLLSPSSISLHAADKPEGKAYVYKQSAGKPRKMEVYLPPNHDPTNAKVPGLILFHGGAWLGGSLDEFRDTCAYFASRGLVCATVDYQMLKMNKADAGKLPPGESHKRVCVTDAKSAIRWFKQHAAEFGMDPTRIITGGSSAGGHISALATMRPDLDDPADPKDIETSVVAYLWINPAFQGNDAKTPEIDIMRHMKADLPPTAVFFGELDGYKKNWNAVQVKWESLGAKSIELQIAPGQDHGFCSHFPAWKIVTTIAMDRFLVKHGFLSGEPTLEAPATREKIISSPK